VRLFVDRDLGKRLPRALKAVGVEAVAHTERYPAAAWRASRMRCGSRRPHGVER